MAINVGLVLPQTKTAKELYSLIFLSEESTAFGFEERKELVRRTLKYLSDKYGPHDKRTKEVRAMTYSDFTNIDMNAVRSIMHDEIGR